jgi:hypothetical protein
LEKLVDPSDSLTPHRSAATAKPRRHRDPLLREIHAGVPFA